MTAKFFELAKRLDAEPVGGIDGTLFRGVTFERLYVEALMRELAEEWQALDRGKPLPTPPPPVPENLLASHFYVTCGDSRWPAEVRDYQRNAAIDRLRRAFGDRATMVIADQGGHGVYPFGRNTCANNTVTAFLTDGQRPAEDLACPPRLLGSTLATDAWPADRGTSGRRRPPRSAG